MIKQPSRYPPLPRAPPPHIGEESMFSLIVSQSRATDDALVLATDLSAHQVSNGSRMHGDDPEKIVLDHCSRRFVMMERERKYMSHIEEAKTRLVFAGLADLLQEGNPAALAAHPALALLRHAVTMVAEKFQGEVRPYYFSYHYREQQANTGLALHIPQRPGQPTGHALPRGIGLVIEELSEALTFRGDFWEVDGAFSEQVQQAIVQHYVVLSQMAALSQMGYQVSTQEVENTIAISGVSYA